MTEVSKAIKKANRLHNKTIDEFNSCPHCKSDFGYYRETRYKGKYNDTTLFQTDTFGERIKHNGEAYENIEITWQSKNYKCAVCHKVICGAEY